MPVEHDVTEAAGVAAGVVSDEVVEAVVRFPPNRGELVRLFRGFFRS